MKKTLFILTAVLFVFTSCTYEPGVSEAFTKYRLKEGVTTVTVPGWVISLAANFGDLEKNEREILESIDKVRVLAVENDDLNRTINLHDEFYLRINKKGDYEELMSVRDENENVTIFGKMDEDVIREMVILVGGEENALVYIKGELKPDLLNDYIDLSETDGFLSLKF